MTAKAKAIRNFLAAGLIGATAAGDKVYAQRHRAVHESQLPGIFVTTERDRVTERRPTGKRAMKYERELELTVAVVVKETAKGAELADHLDDLCEEVESWLLAREFDEGPWVELQVLGTESGLAADSKVPTAAQVVKVQVTYHDVAPRTDAASLDDLETIHAEQDLEPSDAQVDAADTVTVPQD